jgi:hypothetical protein
VRRGENVRGTCEFHRPATRQSLSSCERLATPCFQRGHAMMPRSAGVHSVHWIRAAANAQTGASGGAIEQVARCYSGYDRLPDYAGGNARCPLLDQAGAFSYSLSPMVADSGAIMQRLGRRQVVNIARIRRFGRAGYLQVTGSFVVSQFFMSAAVRSCPAFLMASDRFDPGGNFFACARASHARAPQS